MPPNKVVQDLLKKKKKPVQIQPGPQSIEPVQSIPKELPKPKPEPPKSNAFQTFTGESGSLSGFKTPSGETFIGLKPSEVKAEIATQQEKTAIPQGAISREQAINLEEQRRAGQAIAGAVGQLSPEVMADLQSKNPNFQQAIQAGLATAAPGVVGGAAVGLATGGAASLPLAAVGGIGGFIAGVRSNLKSQTSDEIRKSSIALREREQNLRALITNTNQNPANAAENLMLFNEQLSMIERDRAKLKLQTQQNLNKFLGEDGSPELERYEIFYSAGGSRDLLLREMQIALVNPNPSKNLISFEDLSIPEG